MADGFEQPPVVEQIHPSEGRQFDRLSVFPGLTRAVSRELSRPPRACQVTPHVAQKVKGSTIDGRTTRHAGYRQSLKRRKRI